MTGRRLLARKRHGNAPACRFARRKATRPASRRARPRAGGGASASGIETVRPPPQSRGGREPAGPTRYRSGIARPGTPKRPLAALPRVPPRGQRCLYTAVTARLLLRNQRWRSRT